MNDLLNQRPIMVVLAGPNGAGKTSFFRAYLESSGLRFINADVLAQQLELNPYRAAELAEALRRQLVEQRESFIFETVFSDPVGDKLAFMKEVQARGYTVVLFFIGISSPRLSDDRIAMRVSKGGHDVPPDKVIARFPRVMRNLHKALAELDNVRVYDNSDLRRPYRLVTLREAGRTIELQGPVPEWLRPLLPK
jgi:predicted ABC-type ATPase